jgi:PAS domain S-box-containing protein
LITAQGTSILAREVMPPITGDRAPREPALRTAWRPLHETEHVVQFYETDSYLLRALSDFIGTGLAAGDTCIVVATPAHRAELDERLQSLGLDVATAYVSGQYMTLDAAETLATFMAPGGPDAGRFAAVIGTIVDQAIKSRQRVRIFGEMVALLWMDEQHDAALRLEALWNDLHEMHAFVLFCAYPIQGFGGEAFAQPLSDVCSAHARVIPAESYITLDDPDDRLRAIIVLQQQAQSLKAEIAERKAAEELLRRREQELTDFFENAIVAMHWVGSDGVIQWANRAELELLGYTREEYLGHHIAEFHADASVISDILARLKRGEELHDYEARLQCKDGSTRYVLISSNVHWEGGKFNHTRCFTRDITERKLAEREREQLLAREQQARAEAQEAVRVRDIFLTIAAHELKTPLTSLLGNVQLLQRRSERDGSATAPVVKATRVIVEQAQRLNKMILRLLDVSRIEAGRLSIERAPVDLCALAGRVVDEVQPTLVDHTLDCQLPSGALIIDGDEVRLEQVIQNLLLNAVKYSPGGGPIVVRVEQHDQQARLLVTDVGIGIPMHEQPHLFQRFYRASNAATQYISGMGIGLSVVKEIVTLHGGTVAVESSEGQGSTFAVCLPLGADHRPAEPSASTAEHASVQ